MKPPHVDTLWFKRQLKRAGISQEELGRRLRSEGFTSHGSGLSLAFRGMRKVSPQEAKAISRILDVPLNDILTALGINIEARSKLRVMGYIGAGDAVIIYDEHDTGNGLEEIDSPFPGYTGVVVRIKGDSMAERYYDGEIVAYTPESGDIGISIGREVVAKLEDGRTVLKILQKGTEPDLYTLVSVNRNVPPIVNVAVRWVAQIDWHRPW